MNENTQTTSQTSAKKAPTLTTAQKIAALEEKKRQLIEKSRREETKKKIIIGAAMASLLVDIGCQDSRLASDLIKGMDNRIAQKDKQLFNTVIAEVKEKTAKKIAGKIKAQQAQTQAQAG